MVFASPTSPGSGRSPSWGFTGEAGATLECRLDRGATTISGWATCTSPRSYDLTGLVDGTYTLSLRARDAAGNVSGTTTSSYVLDTAAPVAPTIGVGPTSPGNSRSPAWSFTGEAGATFECQLTRGGTTLSAWSTCTAPRMYDLTGEVDGTYTFATRARDAAGNTGVAATSDYVLDTTAPSAPSITSAPTSPGSADSPSWSFTGDAGSTFQCKLERGATVVSDWATCSSPRSYPLAGEPDGSYTFSVRARDNAGNTGSTTTSAYTLDRAAPSTPSISTSPLTPDNDPTPSWTFTGDPGATIECRLDRGATTIAGWGTCTSPADYDLLAEVDGTYTLSLRARDDAGNVSGTLTDDFVLDRAAPAAPSINSNPGALGSDTTPAWAFSSEAGASFECRLEHSGGSTISDWSSCTSPRSYDISAESDGDFTFRVRSTDTAGNTGAEATHSYTLDRSLPSTPDILTSPATPSTGRMPQWTFAGAVGETFDCRLERDGALVSDWADCTSPHAYNLTGEPDGDYKFLVRAEDALSRVGAPATSQYVLDTTNPAAPTIGTSPATPGNDATPAWSFTAEAGAAFSCRVMRGVTEVIPSASCSSGGSFNLASEPDGAYTLEVVAADAAGNTSTATVSAAYTLDRSAPAQPSIDSSPTSPGNGRLPGWTFSGEAGAAFECRLDRGATVISGWGSCSGTRSYNLNGLDDGTYTFSVRARDAAGNTGLASTSGYVLDTAAPAAPAFITEPASPDNALGVQWTFSGEGGATFQCRLERAGTAVSDWTGCAGSANYDLTGEPDGTYRMLVKATDAAGNTGANATSDYILDTTPPADPTLDSEPASPSSDTSVAWGFSGDGDTAALDCRLRRGATIVSGWASCASPRSFDLSAEVDGDYTFEVVARDAVGNTSGAATDVYKLDRNGPAAPSIDTAPPTPSADSSPSWSYSGEVGADFECRLTRSGTVVSNWGSCSSGTRAYDLTGEADGSYLFAVRARDAAGNTGPAVTSAFSLDRSAPAQPTIDSAPGVAGTGRSPTWSFSADPTSTLECRLERGGTVVSDWATCTSPRSYDLTGAPDGAYTFKVRARNPLGTASAPQTDVYTLDTTAPAAPTIATNPGASGSTRSPAWSFTGEGGATLECRLERSGAAVYDWASCASPLTYDLSGRPDGSYLFKVRATDAAGNTGAASTHSYELDTTGPAEPVLTTAPASPGASRAPAWSWSGESGSAFDCRIDRGGDQVFDWTPCVSGQPHDLSGRPDGTYTLSVRGRDAVGNTGPALSSAYELDTTAGSIAIVSGPAPIIHDRHPAWSFTAEAGAAVTCRLVFGSDVVADWAACASPHSFDLTGKADGDYAFFVRGADAAGNVSPAATWPFRLDTVAPAKPVVDARPPQRDSDRTPEWSFSGEAGAAFECKVEKGSTVVSDWRPCTTPVKVDLRQADDGAYVLSTRATDAAGNVSEPVASSYRLDTTDPEAPEITSKPGNSGDDRKPKWGWRGESGVTFECRLRRGGDTIKDWRSCTTPQAYDLGDERLGTYTFSVRATDAAGNTGPAAADDYELKAASSGGGASGGDSGSGSSGGDGGSAGGSGGDPAPAAPAPAPAAPAATPPAAKAGDDLTRNGDDDAKDDGSGGSKDEGAAGGRGSGPGRGPGGAAAAGPGKGAGQAGGAGNGEDEKDGKRKKKHSNPLGAASESVAKVAAAIAEEPQKTAFPIGLIFVVIGFMSLQGRIDRNDPKLALAPVFADPDLEFRPPTDAVASLGET